jgi:hypothetical protein
MHDQELDYEIEWTLRKAQDPYDPVDQEQLLLNTLRSAWERRLAAAEDSLHRINIRNYFNEPSINEAQAIFEALNQAFSSEAITRRLNIRDEISEAFELGKRHVDAQYRKQKSAVSFGILFGLTEDHALQALTDQMILSAGGFWENELSASIKSEITSWFEGAPTTNRFGTTGPMSRHELVANLKSLVNDRLSTAGKKSLARSYFEGLAEHIIVRSRNVGSFYQASSLGATGYRIVNPLDKRTSGICRELAMSGTIFPIDEARATVQGILTSQSLEELKARVPFLETAAQAVGPVPPLHWRCRSWQEYVFE